VNTQTLRRWAPPWLRRYVLHFEASIEKSVVEFASALPGSSRVLDAGAGEATYSRFFQKHRYCGVDLGIGDATWHYGNLDAVADLAALPFRAGCFDASLNIVTLEHVGNPGVVLKEIARVLKAGASLLLVVPQEWEVHQAPHDYYRFTRFGVQRLLEEAGFIQIAIEPVGGYFRLLARRLLNGLQFFHILLLPVVALVIVPPALLLPALEPLDRHRNFTLGYICHAVKGAGDGAHR
jgi:SAM-dependent methyltransferase